MEDPVPYKPFDQKDEEKSHSHSLISKLVMEAIGTFFLTTTICTADVMGSAGSFAPFAIAGVLMVMIYAGGYISGAHYNPAVTVSVAFRKEISIFHATCYIIIQILAGVLGAVVGCFVLMEGTGSIESFDFSGSVIKIMTAELLFTFALCFVILNVATAEETANNHYFGAAIATVVLAGAFTVGSISLGAFNPAVSFALLTAGKIEAFDIAYHIGPQLIGGMLAALVFTVVNTF